MCLWGADSESEIDPRHKHPLHEASHTVGVKEPPKAGDGKVRTGKRPGEKQIFNEASHKLGYWRPEAPSDKEEDAEAVRQRFEALEDTKRDVITDASKAVLALGALGVVYGDIGTSPLYTEQVIFTTHRAAAHATTAGVYGVVSLIFWALTIIVSIKYAGFIMRAHNRGDGGIMALASLLQRHKATRVATLVTLGIFGAALFFGDGIITPAISVLGSVQGLKVIEPQLAHLVVPISVVILFALFFIQRRGSGAIGWLFGPVILVWFIAIGLLGLNQVLKDPAVFQALSPTWGARFLADHGAAGFLTLGGVVLAVTGAETLYADRGHFGAGPIRLGWFAVAFPALMLNYLGQGVLIRDDPSTAVNPFFLMVPDWAQYPMLFLATAATIIASQAAISGSFSVARQAVQLGYLPRLTVLHPSKVEGQIYVPIVNWGLCIGVIALALIFQSADKLGDIYGVAVTGTFILNTVLFAAVARLLWRTPRRRLVPIVVLFLTVEVSFFAANIAKVEHGAWLPLVVALLISIVMITWRRGQEIVTRNRSAKEGSLTEFLDRLAAEDPPPTASSRRGRLPPSNQGDGPAGAPDRGREHPHVPAEGRDRLGGSGQHPARRGLRAVHGGGDRRRLQGVPRDGQERLPRPDRRPGRAAALPQAGSARTQPRPRACLVLRFADRDQADRWPADAGRGARSCSSRWPGTRRAQSTPSSCRAIGR